MTAVVGQDSGLHGMGLGQIGVQCERPFSSHQAVITSSSKGEAQNHLPKGHERPGARIAGVYFGSADTEPNDRFGPPSIAFLAGDVELPPHEVEIVSLDIVRAALLDGLLLFGQELEFQSLDDRCGDFVLQREDVVEVAVVTLGPEVIVARPVHQLGGDPYAATCFAHTAFQYMVDLEFTCDFRHVDVLALEYESAVAGGHRQRRDLAQIRDDVLGDSVAKILLLRIAAHVGKGQDADRDARGTGSRGGRCRTGDRRHGLGRALASNHGAERANHFLELRTPRILPPVIEVGRMKRAYVDRQVCALKANWDEDAALSSLARLATHPAGAERSEEPRLNSSHT